VNAVRLAGQGISIELPAGWDGLIHSAPDDTATLHAASYVLPAGDGEFASLAIQALPSTGVLLVLTEYGPDVAGHGLFAPDGLPVPVPNRAFRTHAFTRLQPGRYGTQRFCTVAARPFCLYVIVGTDPDPRTLVRQANDVLSTVRIEAKEYPGA